MASTTSTTSTTSRMWYRRPTHQEDHHRRPTHQEAHHRRTSHQERYQQVPTFNQKRRTPSHQPRTPSHQPRYTPMNEGFTTIVKLLFKYVQLSHHIYNWSSLPNSINRDLEKLFGSLKPPSPSQKLAQNLDTFKEETKAGLVSLLTDHISDSIAATEDALIAIPYNKDCDQAAHIAQQQLKRYGKKLNKDFIHIQLLEGLNLLRSSPEFPRIHSPDSDFDWEEYKEEIIQRDRQEIEMESDPQDTVMASDLLVTPPATPPSAEKDAVSTPTTTTTQNKEIVMTFDLPATLPENPPLPGKEAVSAPTTTTTHITDKSDTAQSKNFKINKTTINSNPPLQRDRNGNPLFTQNASTSNTIQTTEPLKKEESRNRRESDASSKSADSTSRRLPQPKTQTTRGKWTNPKKMEALEALAARWR